MQPQEALPSVAYILDLDAQIRANPVLLEFVHHYARVESVGLDKRFERLAH
jgi:hypothetical protein